MLLVYSLPLLLKSSLPIDTWFCCSPSLPPPPPPLLVQPIYQSYIITFWCLPSSLHSLLKACLSQLAHHSIAHSLTPHRLLVPLCALHSLTHSIHPNYQVTTRLGVIHKTITCTFSAAAVVTPMYSEVHNVQQPLIWPVCKGLTQASLNCWS